jgi:hypothetical protein
MFVYECFPAHCFFFRSVPSQLFAGADILIPVFYEVTFPKVAAIASVWASLFAAQAETGSLFNFLLVPLLEKFFLVVPERVAGSVGLILVNAPQFHPRFVTFHAAPEKKFIKSFPFAVFPYGF